jgi:Zn-dependent M32 family carboxypeptidase
MYEVLLPLFDRKVALDLGFSLETGRLDISVHPFTVSAACIGANS